MFFAKCICYKQRSKCEVVLLGTLEFHVRVVFSASDNHPFGPAGSGYFGWFDFP